MLPTNEHDVAVRNYVYNSAEINRQLRGQEQAHSSRQSSVEDDIKKLDESFHGSYTMSDTTLYRGVPHQAGFDNLREGDILTDKGFSSTSREHDQAVYFAKLRSEGTANHGDAGTVFHIETPKGTPALDIEHRAGDRNYDARLEKEVVLPRDSAIVVSSVVKDSNGRTREIHCRWK